MSDQVLKEIDGAVAYITLNRPNFRNAMTAEALGQLLDHLLEVEHDDSVRCVVLRGAGGHFMAGGDINDFKAMLDDPKINLRKAIERRVFHEGNEFPQVLERMPKPVITSIRGAAAGGGAGLALAGDFILASDTAFFLFAHILVGLSPDNGTLWYLQRLVGPLRAKQLLMTGARVNAEEALRLGMVTQIVPDAELDRVTAETAAKLASMPRMALRHIKTLVNNATRRSLAEELQAEAVCTGECAGTPDFREGVMAFIERRPARFG